jgi:iron complex outermembrane receptor protein
MSGDPMQAGLRFDNRQITSIENGTPGEEGYFKAVDRSFDSFNALGYKTNLAQNVTMRLNVASGFRAPNLAELTSNGVHEGTKQIRSRKREFENRTKRTNRFEFGIQQQSF